jgi:hypothetical protein
MALDKHDDADDITQGEPASEQENPLARPYDNDIDTMRRVLDALNGMAA